MPNQTKEEVKMKKEMQEFEGQIFIATIYKKFEVLYIVSNCEEFFRVSDAEAKKIARTRTAPIKNSFLSTEVEVRVDGQRVCFKALKTPKGKHRWAKEIKLIGLGELHQL